MELRINKDMISHIKIYPLRESEYIWCDEIKEEKMFFGFLTKIYPQEEGYYPQGRYSSFIPMINKNEKGYTDIDGVLYFDPFLAVYSGEKKVYGKHYKTVEEIQKMVGKIFPNVNIILK